MLFPLPLLHPVCKLIDEQGHTRDNESYRPQMSDDVLSIRGDLRPLKHLSRAPRRKRLGLDEGQFASAVSRESHGSYSCDCPFRISPASRLKAAPKSDLWRTSRIRSDPKPHP